MVGVDAIGQLGACHCKDKLFDRHGQQWSIELLRWRKRKNNLYTNRGWLKTMKVVVVCWRINNNITSMINKIVGYGGFKSYAEQPYSTIKQGKELELQNQVWSSTKRDADKVHPLDNYNHYNTSYHQQHLTNTEPKDYHPQHVPKGTSTPLNFAATTSLAKPYDAAEAEKAPEPGYRTGFNMLKTGTEHWKTSYQGSICHSAQFNRTYSQGQKTQAPLRNPSVGKPASKQLPDEQLSKAQSYKNRPYINDCKTGSTDYRFNFGEKIGSQPKDLLNHSTNKQPVRDNPLKHGTNQLWTEIPGYQGFKPAELHFEQVRGKMEGRTGQGRGEKKLQVTDNYHVNVPGYAGYKPKFSVPSHQLRDSCFQYKAK